MHKIEHNKLQCAAIDHQANYRHSVQSVAICKVTAQHGCNKVCLIVHDNTIAEDVPGESSTPCFASKQAKESKSGHMTSVWQMQVQPTHGCHAVMSDELST